MSRIIAKNLPKYSTQDGVREHFATKGEITDVKLVNTKEGVFRRFAYIGFKTNAMALAAIKYFNHTYYDTCRLEVEEAFSIGSSDIDRPWSKYSQGSSGFMKHNPLVKGTDEVQILPLNSKQKDFLKDFTDDPKLQEFLNVMKPLQAGKTWGNDDSGILIPVTDTNDNLYEDMAKPITIRDENIPANLVKECAPEIQVLEKEADGHEVLNVHPSRLNWLDENGVIDSKAVINKCDTMANEQHDKEVAENENANQRNIPSVDLIADTGRIMIRNLSYSCKQSELQELVESFGDIVEVHIPISKETKQSRGYGFILFMLPTDALKAYSSLDQTIFQGRIIEVVPAKEKPKSSEELPTGPHAFKHKLEHDRKANASSDFNWNSLFMNSDAVAEAMAQKLGVRKAEIYDTSADNMAVRLALAETNIIGDTKSYLKEHGVDLEGFTKRKTRSTTVILVKNLSYVVEEHDIVELFEQFGTIGRLIFPPSHTMAIVEMIEPNEAKSAFRKIAYSKFKNLPIYLEWAPIDTFAAAFTKDLVYVRKDHPKPATSALAVEGVVKLQSEHQEDPDAMPVATIFVKNLNFETTEDVLKRAFESLNGLRSARISMKQNVKTGGKQSMGFGFLEFNTKDDAMECLKTMQKFQLDGHELLLKFSNSTSKTSKTRKLEADSDLIVTGTKLVVRNIPFEATKQDIKQLFTNFGQVKSVRLPSKFDGSHRGFAFIDFLTIQEAKSAYSSLGATHLYGRHLVIEWAEDEKSVDAIRAKTVKNFKGSLESKKRKIDVHERMDMDE